MTKRSGTEGVEHVLAGRGLPESVRRTVRDAVSHLADDSKVEVAEELVTHFEEGLAKGISTQDLVACFGDVKTAARMIARQKRSRRSPTRAFEKGSRLMIETIRQNVGLAMRRLRKSPGFTAVAIVSLALGIGANTAIFSLVNAVLIRDVPYASPQTLVDVYVDMEDFDFSPLSYPDFRDLGEGAADVFSEVAGSGFTGARTILSGKVTSLAAEMVSSNYFSMLGIAPALGRAFGPDDEIEPGGHPVVMLSHGFWERSYGGDSSVVGTTMELNNRPYTIIGVAPRKYAGTIRGIAPQVFVPIFQVGHFQPSDDDKLESRGTHFFFVKGRLRPGATAEQASVAVDRVTASLQEQGFDEWQAGQRIVVVPTNSIVISPSLDAIVVPALAVVMVVVGLVLLIACANLASFLLARAVDSKREVAIRLAMGATRKALIAQLLTENVLLALLGGAVGVLLASRILTAAAGFDLPIALPIGLDVSIDTPVLGFSLIVSVIAGFAFGLLPAIQATKPDLAGVLRDETTSAGGARGLSLRGAIVTGQVTVSLVLLVTGGLFVRSLAASKSVDIGFGYEPAAVVAFMVPAGKTEEQGRQTARELATRTEALPEVRAAGLVDNLHLNIFNTQWVDFNVDGVEPPSDAPAYLADYARIGSGFFEASGITLLRGRNFNSADEPDSDPVVIVSEAFGRRFFPGGDPIGKMLRRDGEQDIRIVGVASDTKVRTLGEAPRPFIYVPYSQSYSSSMTLVAPTTGDPTRTANDIVALLEEIEPNAVVGESKTMADHLAVMSVPQQLGALVIAAFGFLALVLACVGLYGVVSYAVAQRYHEVGIRLSLGAEAGEVVRMLTLSGLKLVAVGSTAGLLISFAVTRVLGGLLFGVGTLDPFTFVGVPLVFLSVALIATYLPARRASRVDPVSALKSR